MLERLIPSKAHCRITVRVGTLADPPSLAAAAGSATEFALHEISFHLEPADLLV